MRTLKGADFVVPATLLVLSLVPVLGGVVRLSSLSRGAAAAAEDARFLAAPGPVLIHVIAATIYALLGAFQFSTGLRQRYPRWHRRAGVLLLGCGFMASTTGLWMTAAYPSPPSLQGPLLFWVRVFVGIAMSASLAGGWLSVMRRNIAQHEAWMIRAYALGQGAATQAVLFLPLMLVAGPMLGLTRDLLMSAAWALNIMTAEWIIRRRTRVVGRGLALVRSSSALV